jgi:Fe-S-cluster-containing dehydrogenase component
MAEASVIDMGRCCDCHKYQLACKEEHVDNDWAPYARPQPDTGQFWQKIVENVRGAVAKVKMHHLATPCNHCAHLLDKRCELPRCVESGPREAIRFGDKKELRALTEGAVVLGRRPSGDFTDPYRDLPG